MFFRFKIISCVAGLIFVGLLLLLRHYYYKNKSYQQSKNEVNNGNDLAEVIALPSSTTEIVAVPSVKEFEAADVEVETIGEFKLSLRKGKT